MSRKKGLARWVRRMRTQPNGGVETWGRSHVERWNWTSVVDREIRHIGATIAVANFNTDGSLGHVRLAVPELGTFWLLRTLRRILEKDRVPYLTLARDARDQAVIKSGSIVIIDKGKGDGLIPGDTLFKGEVNTEPGWQNWQRRRSYGAERWRTAFFLSGFDRREPGVAYFLCELPPKAAPSTVAEAYEALKPGAVKIAEQMGRKVKRQGDIFFIPTPTVIPQGDVIEKGFIDGSNHRATRMIEQDGVIYVQGNVVHAPTGRRPDHFPVHIGRTWHVAIKNTVPQVR